MVAGTFDLFQQLCDFFGLRNEDRCMSQLEQIFAVPGIGRAFVSSITNRDYPMVMGTTIILAALVVVMNFVGDILYKVVDPRINLE